MPNPPLLLEATKMKKVEEKEGMPRVFLGFDARQHSTREKANFNLSKVSEQSGLVDHA